MNFNWSSTEQELLGELAEAVDSSINPLIAARADDGLITMEEWNALGETGLLGLSAPKEYGGRGMGAANAAMLYEAFGSRCQDMGLVFASGAHLFACVMAVTDFGGEELKKQFLPAMIAGELAGANAASEDNAGSDLFSMATTFEKQGDLYVINGEKSYVANAPNADVVMVYAGKKTAPGFFGTSAFLVECETPGVTVEEPFEEIGLHSVQSSKISFKNCKVSAENLIGSEGQGGIIFNRAMQWERLGLYAGYVGAMEKGLDETIHYARKRKQFGKKISSQQAVSHKIVDMKIRLESAKLLLYKACCTFDEGKNALLETSLAKIAISEAAVLSGIDSLSIFAGAGYKAEAGASASLNDALATLSASGTPDMLREIAAAEMRL